MIFIPTGTFRYIFKHYKLVFGWFLRCISSDFLRLSENKQICLKLWLSDQRVPQPVAFPLICASLGINHHHENCVFLTTQSQFYFSRNERNKTTKPRFVFVVCAVLSVICDFFDLAEEIIRKIIKIPHRWEKRTH